MVTTNKYLSKVIVSYTCEWKISVFNIAGLILNVNKKFTTLIPCSLFRVTTCLCTRVLPSVYLSINARYISSFINIRCTKLRCYFSLILQLLLVTLLTYIAICDCIYVSFLFFNDLLLSNYYLLTMSISVLILSSFMLSKHTWLMLC